MAHGSPGLAAVPLTTRARALILEPEFYSGSAVDRLEQFKVEYKFANCQSREEMLAILKDAEERGMPFTALFVRLGLSIDDGVFDVAKSLKWVVTPTTGQDHIDTRSAHRRGVHVLSLRGHIQFLRTVSSTAELTIGLLISLIRHIPPAHADVMEGRWVRKPFAGRELRGMSLGLIGLGRLGTLVAGYGSAFGMKVLACDERDEAFESPECAHVQRLPLEGILAESDVVSLHLPLTERTRGILDESRIALMKRGAYLVNTARGELVQEDALLRALESGAIGGCALDVMAGDARWEGEAPPRHPLIEYARRNKNVILTPHIGGFSEDAIVRTRAFMVDRFCEVLGNC